jgi:hypothetical protein
MHKIVNGDPNVLDNGLTAAAYFCWVRWLASPILQNRQQWDH